MESIAHEQGIEPPIRLAPPRTFVLVFGLALLGLVGFLAASLSSAPSASAQTTPTSYDLCQRTTAVRHEILLALQYPSRDRGQAVFQASQLGTLSSSYPQATWGTLDTSNNNGVYSTDPCSTTGASLRIDATALASDANWIGWRKAMRLRDKNLTQLIPSDFAGLTELRVLDIDGNSITEIPDGIFQSTGTITFASNRGNTGLAPSCKWFGTSARHVTEIAINGSGITHSDIPHDAFDSCFDTTQTASFGDSTQLGRIKLRDQTRLGHVNLRWFARLANLDRLELDNSIVDTYFYAEGPTDERSTVRYVNGSKQRGGATDVTSNDAAARNAMGAAIKSEIDRYWASTGRAGTIPSSGTGNSALIGNSGRVGAYTVGFNLCDTYDRHPEGSKYIIAKFRDPDGNTGTPVPAAFTNLGCGASEVSHVTKSQAFSAFHWDTWRRPFWPNTGRWDEFRPSEIKGLNVTGLKLTGSGITSLPAGILQGSNVAHFDAKWMNRFEFEPRAWYGTSASVVTTLAVPRTRANHTNFATHDYFDAFTNLSSLDLRETDLGYINTRWFDRLTNLNWLGLGGAWVAKYFYDADGNDPTSMGAEDYWDKSSLSTAIIAARTAQGTTRSLNVAGTPKIAIDFCDRPRVIWAEIMRNFKFLVGDDEAYTDAWVLNAGDVRHARYNAVTQAECRPVRGLAVVKSSSATVNPENVPYDAAVHGRIMDTSGINLRMRFYDSTGLGPTLNPDHFADFENVKEIMLDRSGISSIPADTFAEARDVEVLSLAGNSLDNADLTGTNFLQYFTKLRSLTLNDNLLTEFNSNWLPVAARGSGANPLRTLRLASNPIKTVDVTGLDLWDLRIENTHITEIDASILALDNLRFFWWFTPTLTLDGLHSDGTAAFLRELPATLRNSEPSTYIGNELRLEDDDLNAAAFKFQQDHHARLRAINSADTGNDVVTRLALKDPCIGSTCLTEAQKNSFIDSVASFEGLEWISTDNANLSDAQMVRLLRSFEDHPMRRINLISNPNAFGAGFDNSQLSVFSNLDWRGVWSLQIVDSALNYTQASTILSNLATTAFDPSVIRDAEGNVRWNQHYFEQLDLSHNPDLFTGATTQQLSTFLNGVTAIRKGWGPFTLRLAGTNLDFDKLKAILDSIEQFDAAPDNAHGIRLLDVSGNPNLWNRKNPSTGQWENVSLTHIGRLVDRLRGLTNLNIDDTGLTAYELRWIMSSLAANNSQLNLNIKSSMARMAAFSIAGVNLGSESTASLENTFTYFGGRYATAAPALRSLNLARTRIDCQDLAGIADGLETAGVLGSITNLNLDGNPDLFNNCESPTPPPGLGFVDRINWETANAYTKCDPTSATDPVVTLFSRFTNLRTISFDDTSADFNEVQCVVEGLDNADGTADDAATQVRSFSVMDNPNAFTVPATATDEATAAPTAMVTALFQALPNARKVLTNTGLTPAQATAALGAEQEGQDEDEQRETARRFAAQNPAFTFKTPHPTDMKVESGRGSVRVTFTHDPMYNNAPYTVLRYEYRYRVRPDNAGDAWGSEVWRTASIDLDERGPTSFVIFGLEPETVYQVQLRISSLARPTVIQETGGTNINLPTVNRIEPTITEVSMRAGDTVRLEVDVYGTADRVDNTIPDEDGSKLVFDWSETPSGGAFAAPGDQRRVVYTAPSLPGTYTITAQAQPDGICRDHHKTNFDISDADRAPCIATFTIRVSRAPTPPEAPGEPINPTGPIPTSLSDASGVDYTVFRPVEGGMFTSAGITVSAAKGAVPDEQLLGVRAAVSSVLPPAPVPGASMTIAGDLYDINGIQQDGDAPVQGFTLDDPLTACLPMPTELRANISDVVVVERKSDGSYGILSTKLRQSAGGLTVCGSVSTLPATIGVAKLGVVVAPPATPTPEIETPDTGATAPSTNMAGIALGAGIALIAVAIATAAVLSALRRRRSSTHDTSS